MLLLTNAKIYTMGGRKAIAEAILVDDQADFLGRIIDLGNSERLIQEYGHLANKLDMGGSTIFPGFVDAHIHFRRYSLSQELMDADTDSLADCIDRVAKEAERQEEGSWILGHGWRQNNWPEGFGSAEMLDKVSPNNPVYLTAASLHAGWANSLALKAAGIGANTQNPEKGEIDRDSNGRATGILFEHAMKLVSEVIPQADVQQSVSAMKKAQACLWKMGITGIHDFDRLNSFAALQQMRSDGDLQLRVLKNLPVESLEHIIAIGLRSGFGDDFLRIGGIKDFSDGALGSLTAAMIDPYEGESDNRGMLLVDSEQMVEWGEKAVSAGLSMTIHAIGDRANYEVLNAYEQIRNFERENGIAPLRHRIEHVQITHPEDQQRLAALGIAASVQPIHAPSDRETAERYWGKRTKHAYAWKSLSDSGAMLAFGSDAPVESPNPFAGIHAAVTRQDREGKPGIEGWHGEQKIELYKAIEAFTLGPSFLSGTETKIGRLEKKFLADLIVLKEDPFEIPSSKLREIKPTGTMLGGNWVWQGPGFTG